MISCPLFPINGINDLQETGLFLPVAFREITHSDAQVQWPHFNTSETEDEQHGEVYV